MADLEPLTPPECDLTDFPFMPLYIARLKQSKSWALARRTPALAFYLVNLWTASWHGRPAGSLEDDDMMLADAAECDPRLWSKMREPIMRGWTRCSDGRFYHPVIAEIVADSWKRKVAQRERTEAARRAKEAKRAAALSSDGQPPDGGATETVTSSVTDNVTRIATRVVTADVTESVADLSLHPRDRDRDRDRDSKKDSASLRSAREPDARDRLWAEGLPVLLTMTGMPDGKARALLGRLVKSAGDDCAAVMAALIEAAELRPFSPVPWLTEAVKARSGRRESSVDRIRRDWDLPGLADLDASAEAGGFLNDAAARTIQ